MCEQTVENRPPAVLKRRPEPEASQSFPYGGVQHVIKQLRQRVSIVTGREVAIQDTDLDVHVDQASGLFTSAAFRSTADAEVNDGVSVLGLSRVGNLAASITN